jgi:hypothetical protein
MTPGHDHVNRLREETFRLLDPRFDGIEKEIRGLYSLLLQTFGQIEQKLRDARDVDLTPAASVLTEAFKAEIGRQAENLSTLEQFVSEVRRLETQEEILGLLLDRAHRHASRMALFATRGERIQGWSSRGYDEETAAGISSYASSTSNPMFAKVLGSHGRVTLDDLCDAPGLVELLSPGAKGPWHFFPMTTLGRSVALLVAAGTDEASPHPEMLSLIVEFAGLRIENLALRILREMEAATAPRVTAPAPAAPRIEIPRPFVPVTEPLIEQPTREAAEATAPAEVSAFQEEQPPPEPPSLQEVPPQPEVEQVAAEVEAPVIMETAPPVAAQSEEQIPWLPVVEEVPEVPATAFETAGPAEPAAVEQPVSEPSQPAESGPVEVPAGPVEVPVEPAVKPQLVAGEDSQRFAEEERLHSDAKRFARLLVSEIKLYNEQRVLEGRENRDIYVRLKRDIDRSREMYQKRVSPTVSRKVDYFHDELIRILGDNDPSHLGSDYPGPLVES